MRRSTIALSDILKRALPDKVSKRIYSIELLEKRWAHVVGPELARRSEPELLAHGVLTVRVTDPAWGRMILKLQRRIIPALNRAMGSKLVERINFNTRSEFRNERAPLPRESRLAAEPAPEAVRQAAESISSPELRELVTRSAANYLRAQRERGRN